MTILINRYINQPEEQNGGVRETIGNYLQYFLILKSPRFFARAKARLITSARLMMVKLPA